MLDIVEISMALISFNRDIAPSLLYALITLPHEILALALTLTLMSIFIYWFSKQATEGKASKFGPLKVPFWVFLFVPIFAFSLSALLPL